MTWKTRTHALAHPVEFDGSAVHSITLREPDLDALERIEALGLPSGDELPSLVQVRGMIEALSGLPTALVGKLHRDDFTAVAAFVVPLLTGDAEASPV